MNAKREPELFRAALDELATVLGRINDDAIDAPARACRRRQGCCLWLRREALQIKGFAMRMFHLGLPVSVVTRQGDVFFVTAGPGETTSVLPMGSAYEGTLFVLFEIMVLKLKALLDGVD